MTMPLSVQLPTETREKRVQAVFDANGRAMSLRDLAKACIRDGVWSEDEIRAIAVKSVMESCRRVLNQKDAAGLPANGPTDLTDDDGAPVWMARQLWLLPAYERNILNHLQLRDENHLIAVRLAAEAEDRFGQPIAIPDLPDMSA